MTALQLKYKYSADNLFSLITRFHNAFRHIFSQKGTKLGEQERRHIKPVCQSNIFEV